MRGSSPKHGPSGNRAPAAPEAVRLSFANSPQTKLTLGQSRILRVYSPLQMNVPFAVNDPVNARILAVSEDKIQGFQRDPLGEIARQSAVPLATVIERIQAMLRAGTIRRV